MTFAVSLGGDPGRGVSVLRLPDPHEVLRDKVMGRLDEADGN